MYVTFTLGFNYPTHCCAQPAKSADNKLKVYKITKNGVFQTTPEYLKYKYCRTLLIYYKISTGFIILVKGRVMKSGSLKVSVTPPACYCTSMTNLRMLGKFSLLFRLCVYMY
jgi:hypothetical protein